MIGFAMIKIRIPLVDWIEGLISVSYTLYS